MCRFTFWAAVIRNSGPQIEIRVRAGASVAARACHGCRRLHWQRRSHPAPQATAPSPHACHVRLCRRLKRLDTGMTQEGSCGAVMRTPSRAGLEMRITTRVYERRSAYEPIAGCGRCNVGVDGRRTMLRLGRRSSSWVLSSMQRAGPRRT